MLAGIGVIIIIKQVPHALGYDLNNMASEKLFEGGNYSIAPYLLSILSGITLGVIVVAVVSFAILLLWDNVAALRKVKLLPGALVAVVVSILLNEFFIMTGSSLAIGTQHLVNLTVINSFSDIGNLITLPDFRGFLNPNVWIIGATIAIVASIETLLCIEAADRMDTHRRITDTNLELRAQGIGNVISSLLGGLPMTSVVVRSSANANAGASSKLSTIIHGLLLLLSVLAIPFLLNKIPLATLAAVLILVGYKLAKPAKIMHFWHKGRSQFIPFIATLVAVVATDLLKGVGIGLFISVVYILQGNMKRAYCLSREELEDADDIKIILTEEVSFLNKAAIKKTLKNIKPNSKVTIDACKTSYIAADVLELIEDFTNIRAKEADIDVKLYGFKTVYAENKESRHSHVIIKHRRSI